MPLDVHVVSHTHWDREWYHPLERFRQKLVALIDELLDEPPEEGQSFLLDGQAIVVEDYLEIRPERASEIGELLRSGRLEAGPWYVLADELIPSGEALVRNLLTGRRILRRFGATPPDVLYCPDSFGHPAALPAIASGFGFPVIVLWRGYGGPRWPSGDTARWMAPNGDVATVFHLPKDGYEFGSHLPVDADSARERWARMRAELASRARTGVTLVPNGADHHARQLGMSEALAALEAAGRDDGVHRSSLRAFGRSLVDRAAAAELPMIRGELRDSYGYTWALQGTFATRAHEKRANAIAERTLLREAEPWSALAARAHSSRRPLVEQAWRTLLSAHPHDTICGCSIDDVADAMELRLRSATNQAIGIRDDSITDLIGHDAVAAREARDRWTQIVVARNPAPRRRSGVAIVDIEEFVADVGVGPGSAPMHPIAAVVPRGKPRVPALGPLQVLSRRLAYSRTESPRHYPDNDLVAVTQVAAWVNDAPAYGIASYAFSGAPKPNAPTDTVTSTSSSIRNGTIAVDVDDAGVVTLENSSGERIEGLLALHDEADVGDLYTPAPREKPHRVVFRGIRRVHRGPLRGELALTYRIVDGTQPRRTLADVVVHLTLDAGASFLRVRIRGENQSENHRVRLAIKCGFERGEIHADAAFGSVRREPIVVSDTEAAIERPPATAPLHRYISRYDDRRGFTVFSDGLAEYEAREDGSILITLVRGVGQLSRNDLPERPGHAGWPIPTPGAQCIGPFDAELALMPHGARTPDVIDAVERAADDVLNPIRGVTLRSALAVPEKYLGVELQGKGLAFSAVKQSETGDAIVLRCVNLLDEDVDGAWRMPFRITAAQLARLDETVIEDVRFDHDVVQFRAGPRAIVTLLVR